MNRCVLLVDDDKTVYETVRSLLGGEGLQIFWACNGEQFRSYAFSEKWDLILLDIGLGDENGMDVYGTLLKDGLIRTIPVIFLSSMAGNKTPKPLSPGRTCALHGKPLKPEEFLRDIRFLLNSNGHSKAT